MGQVALILSQEPVVNTVEVMASSKGEYGRVISYNQCDSHVHIVKVREYTSRTVVLNAMVMVSR
jgi:hypothetical protein